MTSRPLWLSATLGLAYIITGLSELLRLGPRALPTSWVLIFAALPDWAWWIWPATFVLTGIVAVIGVRVPRMAWVGFRLASTIFGCWGLVGVWGWSQGRGGNIPGSASMFVLAVSLWMLSDYVSEAVAKGKIITQVAAGVEKIGVEKVEAAVEAATNGG